MNILLIDDDSDDREMFCEAVDTISTKTVCYTEPEGNKALKKLDNDEICIPDIIFLDINMPTMSGWKILGILKASECYKNIPVVMYSTSSYPEDILKAQDMGAFCFFSKPASFNELRTNLEILITSMLHGTFSSVAPTTACFSIFQEQ